MGSGFENFADRFVPDGLDEEAHPRARFFVQGWLVAIPFAGISTVIYALTGNAMQVALNGVMLVVAPLFVWALRRTGRITGLTHASLAVITVAYGLALLSQSPPDNSNVAVLVVVPLLAGFLLGPRQAFVWVVVPTAMAVLSLELAQAGVLYPFRDETPVFSAGLNVGLIMTLSWLFAVRYDDVRAVALRKAMDADRAKSTFLATISHEIRTPMNGMLGMTEVLLTEPMAVAQRDKLQVMQRSGHLLVSLINNLLDLTKMESGKLTIDGVDFDPRALASDLSALYSPAAAQKNVALRVEVDDDVPRGLHGDVLRLRQVLGNLVNNATKFTEAGEVVVRVARDPGGGDGVRFSIRDTGVGIAPEVLPRLFVAFEQGDGSTTRRFGGTGLGLAVSQQLVERMGGTIAVRSTRGQGSEFTFTLPLPATALPTASSPSGLVRLSSAGALPVLVVDDNPINLRVAAALVERLGFKALTATNGRHALERLVEHDVSCVLMDCHMPEMDGFEATERVRNLPDGRAHTPIIALTASASPEDVEACRRAGMSEVLAKPVTLAALAETLGRVSLRRGVSPPETPSPSPTPLPRASPHR